MKRLVLIISALAFAVALHAQPAQLILHQENGCITFAIDEVDRPNNMCGIRQSGQEMARNLNRDANGFLFSDWEPEIIASSFADAEDLYDIGEDVVFQMLLKAWCQHRPVVLSPDAIWLVVCQQFSRYVNEHPEEFRSLLVRHEGKQELKVETSNPLEQVDWGSLVAGFTAEIAKYTNNGIATTLVADFTTTGADERIASEVTLMDVVKPYFDYTVIYAVCGIPSITLTGTPADWRKVLEKVKALDAFGFDWWTAELEPLLEEFVKAAEGHPDYWFWKDIVKKTRPQTIQGPSCTKRRVQLTKFDGWFLKFFPFDNKGRTPREVDITQTMLPETVAVPFKYQVIGADGTVLSETALELVAGIIGVQEDAQTFTMTPKIGWFVRTAKPDAAGGEDVIAGNSYIPEEQDITMGSSIRYWNEGPLTFDDFSTRSGEFPQIIEFDYGISWAPQSTKMGNTVVRAPCFRSFMNPYTSWVHPDFKTEEMLQYIQTGFDYVEICRRRAQKEYQDGSAFNLEDVVNFHSGVAGSFLARMKEDTRQGLDSAAVRYYSTRVKKELAQTADITYDDLKIYPRGFGIGMHLGAGSEFYTGPLTGYVTPIAGIDFGFDLAFSRVNLYLSGLLGWGGHFKQDIPRDGYKWEAGKRIRGGNMEVSLGYTVYDSQWWRIAPFAGIGVGFIDYPFHPTNPKKNSDEISGFRFQAGISADYKFYRLVEYFPEKDGLSEFSVKTRLYVAHTAFPAPAPAWTINFGLSANMMAWMLKK